MSLLSAVEPVEEGPLERYLTEQADLTAVERFSQRHHAGAVPDAGTYRELVPAVGPRAGQQYAFDVDLDACTGCKACVTGCHSLNGLAEGEGWRQVTLLRASPVAPVPFQQSLTAACHHCIDPACLKGCPVDAYEKDPVTGIVRHLDDQCIGCTYCTLTCPYEVPSYRPDLGIVRKCDMCSDRLAAGEAPACVQACPNGAIAITVVDLDELKAESVASVNIPAAPPSSITTPSTRYRSRRPLIDALLPSGPGVTGPAHAHPPLSVMLVLTQLSVGTFVANLAFARHLLAGGGRSLAAIVAAAAGVLALAASVFHLGRPRYAYRAIIGLRHSWLSREVLAFGAFTGLAVLYAVLLVCGSPAGAQATDAVGVTGALAGLAGIACSVALYSVTRRVSWTPVRLSAAFGATTAGGGALTLLWTLMVSGAAVSQGSVSATVLAAIVVAGTGAKLAAAAGTLLGYRSAASGPDATRRARLMLGPLARTTRLRFAGGVVGGILCPLALLAGGASSDRWIAGAVATMSLSAFVAGELAERRLFFTTASVPR